MEVEFYKLIEGPKPHKYEKAYCDRKQHIVINTHSIQESLELSQQEVLRKVANWMSEASGWVVNQVRRHYVILAKYNPLKEVVMLSYHQSFKKSKGWPC